MLCETAYAKINLALHVRARRADGYHELESLFLFAQDGDRLSAEPAEELSLTLSGPFAAGLDNGADNLVIRAAQALRRVSGTAQGAAIHLVKALPVASGIGGGSADAAATLRLLSASWNVSLAPMAMQDIALELGSDVPACIGSHMQYVAGRGERLGAGDVPGLAGMPMLLVNPGVAVSTGPVFAGWDGVDRGPLDIGSLDRLIRDGRNDLEPAAMAIAPVIGEVLDMLRRQDGVRLARMSGSGATCFALFDDSAARDAVADAMTRERPAWWTFPTRIRTI